MEIKRLTNLLFLKVVDAQGKILGHVYDVHCEDRNGRLEIAALHYGWHGLLESLGVRDAKMEIISWDQIERVTEKEVILR
jgi:sporulation protein YlmC with PRC-barrel domain